MTAIIQGSQLRNIRYGTVVTKSNNSIGGDSATIFTISGGLIIVTLLIGQVTTVVGGATNLNITVTPTAGVAADICAATAIDADAVGTLYTITGCPAELVSRYYPGEAAAVPLVSASRLSLDGLVLRPGVISQKTSAAQTGKIKWYLGYEALDNGASVS